MEKVDEIDFKTDASVPEEPQKEESQPQKTEQAPKEEVKEIKSVQEPQQDDTEDVSNLPKWAQDRLNKTMEERDNLSKAVTRLNKERKLPTQEEVTEETEVYPEWDETSKKFQQQTLNQAEKRAEAKAQAVIEKSNEKTAIDKFVEENPDADWDEMIKNYTPTHGKGTVGDIVKDLKRALVVTRYEKGELSEREAKEAKAKIADMSTVSKTTSKTDKGKPNITPGALSLAEKLRVNPEKLAQEDDSLTAENKF